MKSYTVYVNFRWRVEYNIEAENEEDIPQIIYDGLITSQYGIDDVDDWSDYDIEIYENED